MLAQCPCLSLSCTLCHETSSSANRKLLWPSNPHLPPYEGSRSFSVLHVQQAGSLALLCNPTPDHPCFPENFPRGPPSCVPPEACLLLTVEDIAFGRKAAYQAGFCPSVPHLGWCPLACVKTLSSTGHVSSPHPHLHCSGWEGVHLTQQVMFLRLLSVVSCKYSPKGRPCWRPWETPSHLIFVL